MANKRIEYTVGFKGDASQLKATLSEVTTQLNKLGTGSSNQLTSQLREASNAALDLSMKLQQATNQDTGKLDLMTFSKSLTNSGKDLQHYATQLSKLGPEGRQAFKQVSEAIIQAEMPIRRSSKALDSMWTTMKNTMKWQLSSSVLHGFMSAVQTAYGYTQDLNESLNNIRIVSGKSADEMKEFAKEANKAAQALSTTTTEYTDASLIYFQQGLTDKEVEERTEATIKLANVTGQSAQEVSDQMTAIWNNFDDGSKSLEYYADVITALGAETASSTEEISTGLEKFAAVAETVGLSYEYATSALATVTAETRQSAEVVGTAFKTLFARIQDLELGDTLDDGTTLGKYSEALSIVGINIKEQNGELKDMDDILDELGNKWQTLNDDQKVSLAQTVAGVRQYTQLIALMDNWEVFQKNLSTATGATGSLDRQAEIYAESWEAARDRTKAAAENVYDSIINEDFFIDMNEIFEPFLNGLASVIDAMGGMKGVANTLFYVFTTMFGDKLAAGLRQAKDNFLILTGVAQKSALELKKAAVNSLSEFGSGAGNTARQKTSEAILALEEKILKSSKSYTNEEAQQILNEKKKLELKQQQIIAEQESIQNLQETKMGFERFGLKEDIEYNQSGDNWQQNLAERYTQNDSTYGINDKAFTNSINNALKLENSSKGLEKTLSAVTKKMSEVGQRSAEATKLREKMIGAASGSEKLQQELIQIGKELGLVNGKTKNFETALNSVDKNVRESGQEINALRQILSELGVSPEAVNRYTDTVRNLGQESFDAKGKMEAFNQEAEKLGDDIGKGTFKNRDFATSMVKVSNTLSQVGMGIQAIQALGNVFTDENLSATEKFTQLLTSTAMIMPMLATGYNSLTASITKAASAEGMYTVGTGKGITAKLADVVITKVLKKSTDGAAAATVGLGTAIASIVVPIALVAGAAIILVKIIDHFVISQKEATENIKKANETYEEEASKLEEINNKLKTTQDRLKELQDKDSLTFVEQEELKKLERQNDLLERQKEIQEEITKAERKKQIETIAKNVDSKYKDAVTNKYYTRNLDSGTVYRNFTPDEYLKNIEDRFGKDSDTTKAIIQNTIDPWRQEIEEQTTEYIANYGNLLVEAETELFTLIEGLNEGIVSEDAIQNHLANIKEMRIAMVGGSTEDYAAKYVAPLVNSEEIQAISQDLYQTLATGGSEDAKALITDEIKQTLYAAGVNVEEFLNYLDGKIDGVKADLESKDGLKGIFDTLTPEDLEIVAQLNLENIDTVEELWAAIERYKNTEIDLDVNVSGTETLMEIFDKIEAKNDPLENILKTYRDKGKITVSEAQSLIKDNPEYIKYLKQVGDHYVLTEGALEEYNEQLDQQAYLVEQAMEAEKKKYDIDTSTLDVTKKLLEESQIENSKNEEDIVNGFETYSTAIDNYKADVAGSYEDLLKATDKFINDNSVAFKNLDFITDEQTDNAEKAFVATFDTINQALANNEKLYKAGKISATDYYKNAQQGAETLTKLAKSSGAIQQVIENGQQKFRIDPKALKEMEESGDEAGLAQAQALVDSANNYLRNQGKIKAGAAIVELFDSYADTLQNEKYTNAAGLMDFDDGEFAKAKGELKSFADSAEGVIKGLETTNNEVYNQIIKKIKDTTEATEGAELDISEALLNNEALFEDVTNTLLTEAGLATTTLGSTIGSAITALGDLISNFEYTIKFTPVFDNPVKLLNSVAQMITGQTVELPSFGFKISGTAGADTANAIKTFSEQAASLGDYYEQMNLNRGNGNSGINAFGEQEEENDNNILDRNKIDLEDDDPDKKKEKQKKDLKEIEDAYHEITRQIEAQDRALKKLDTQMDRTWGSRKLAMYDDYQAELNKAIDKQEELTEIINEQQKLEKNKLDIALKASGLQADYDKETGEIENYTELYKAITDQINEKYKWYNNLGVLEQEKEANKKILEDAEDKYEKLKELLDAYEATIDKEIENAERIEELKREQADKRLEEVSERLEIILTVKDMKDAAREFSIAIEESFGDALTHAEKVAELKEQGVKANMDMVATFTEQYNTLQSLLNESYEPDSYLDTAEIISQIENLQGEVIATGEAMLEWIEYIEDLLPSVIDAARERFEAFTKQLDHNKTIASTIKELMTLQGLTYKTVEGFNSLQKASQAQLDASLAKAELNKQWMERAAKELEIAEAALATKTEGDAGYDTLKNNRDALLEEFNAAQEEMYSSAKEAMEMAKEMYTLAIEEAMYSFEQAVTGGLGGDLLQMKYDNLIAQEEKYLGVVEQEYEISKWNRDLQQSIDKANSSYAASRLKALQDELELRKQNGKLTEYDLEYMRAKYDLTTAQIALEEAQNAKTSMRLVRNSRGTFDYVYSADQNAIDEAQQKLEDAQYNLYKISEDMYKKSTSEIAKIKAEAAKQIEELYKDETLTAQERTDKIKEIEQKLAEDYAYWHGMMKLSAEDMAESSGKSFADLGTEFNEIMDLMNMDADEFQIELKKALGEAETAFQEYQGVVKDVADKTGTDLTSLNTALEKVNENTGLIKDTAKDAIEAMWDQISVVHEMSRAYAELAEQVMEAIRKLEELANAMANTAAEESGLNIKDVDFAKQAYDLVVNKGYSITEARAIIEPARAEKIEKLGMDASQYGSMGDEFWDMLYNIATGEKTAQYYIDSGKLDKSYADMSKADKQYASNFVDATTSDKDSAELVKQGVQPSYEYIKSLGIKATFKEWEDIYEQGVDEAVAWLNKKEKELLGADHATTGTEYFWPTAFATGGYTGDFDNAKLAFLHEKELVLNQSDTSNILSAVDLAREFLSGDLITRAFNAVKTASLNLLNDMLRVDASYGRDDGTLKQEVSINASFPNVSSAREIEEALNNLINDAAQFASINNN